MEFYKLILFVLSKYTVLFCIVFTVKGICVLSLVLSIFYSRYIGQETAFLCSHCFRGLFVILML